MNRVSRPALVGVAALALALGYAAGAWWRSPPPRLETPRAALTAEGGVDSEPSEALLAELAKLQADLDAERGRRGALELELAVLRSELANRAGAGDPVAPEPEPSNASGRDSQPASPPGPAAGPEDAGPEARDWFDAGLLLELGVDEPRSEWLRENFEDLQMSELYLRDQATREGTLGRPAYFMQGQNLRKQVRETLGAEDYDLMLYASGRNNRVQVRGLLQSSPAAVAGVEVGDIVLRYDDVRILAPADLTGATALGKAGSSVALDVLRGDSTVRLYLPRGPLGAQIVPARRPPRD